MSYLSRVSYPNLTGSTSSFVVGVPYLDPTHIHVFLVPAGFTVEEAGVLLAPSTDYTFTSPGLIGTTTAPTGGKTLEVRRVTPVDAALVTFQAGTISSTGLNLLATQLLYAAQEAQDAVSDGFPVATYALRIALEALQTAAAASQASASTSAATAVASAASAVAAAASAAGLLTAVALVALGKGVYPNSATVTVPSGLSSGDIYYAESADGLLALPYYDNAGSPAPRVGVNPLSTSLLASFSKAFTGYTVSDSDPAGPKVLLAADQSGIAVQRLSAPYLNNRDVETVLRDTRRAASLLFDYGHIMSDGQSLNASGVGGGGFDIPDARSFAWPYTVANPSQGTETPFLASSTVNNGTQAGSSPAVSFGVGPWHGGVAMLRYLLEHEEGIAPADQPILYLGNNAVGATFISAHVKGTTPYNVGQQQALATRTKARAMGLRARLLAKFWGQGESETSTSAAAYYAAQLLIAQNDAADYRASAPEQEFDPLQITSATASNKGTNRWGIARAQHKLALDYPALIGFSNALYQLPYTYDYGGYSGYNTGGLHPSQLGAFIEGLPYGLTLKRKLMDNDPSLPIHPVSRSVDGNLLFITFALRRGKRLAIDTTTVPSLTNWGFSAYNENTSANIAFSSAPKLCSDFRTFAFNLGVAPVAGMRIDVGGPGVGMYPYSPGAYAGNPGSYIGAATNVRDDYTLRYKYPALGFDFPLYDWMPVMSIRLTNTAPGFELILS